jgi:hypothetical protein
MSYLAAVLSKNDNNDASNIFSFAYEILLNSIRITEKYFPNLRERERKKYFPDSINSAIC